MDGSQAQPHQQHPQSQPLAVPQQPPKLPPHQQHPQICQHPPQQPQPYYPNATTNVNFNVATLATPAALAGVQGTGSVSTVGGAPVGAGYQALGPQVLNPPAMIPPQPQGLYQQTIAQHQATFAMLQAQQQQRPQQGAAALAPGTFPMGTIGDPGSMMPRLAQPQGLPASQAQQFQYQQQQFQPMGTAAAGQGGVPTTTAGMDLNSILAHYQFLQRQMQLQAMQTQMAPQQPQHPHHQHQQAPGQPGNRPVPVPAQQTPAQPQAGFANQGQTSQHFAGVPSVLHGQPAALASQRPGLPGVNSQGFPPGMSAQQQALIQQQQHQGQPHLQNQSFSSKPFLAPSTTVCTAQLRSHVQNPSPGAPGAVSGPYGELSATPQARPPLQTGAGLRPSEAPILQRVITPQSRATAGPPTGPPPGQHLPPSVPQNRPPPNPLNAARLQEHHMQRLKTRRSKRSTDKRLSQKMESVIPESKLYRQLLELEHRMDATLMRKSLDVQDALVRPSKTPARLRIYVSNLFSASKTGSSNSVIDQEFGSLDKNPKLNPSPEGALPAHWSLRIEGKLLYNSTTKQAEELPDRYFTHFVNAAMVQIDYLDWNGAESQNKELIEWRKPSEYPERVGLEIKRILPPNHRGSIRTRVFLYLDHGPGRYKVSEALNTLVGAIDTVQAFQIDAEPSPSRPRNLRRLFSKSEIVVAVWQYVKFHRLQDPEDRRIIRCDPAMQRCFTAPKIAFPQIPYLLAPHLSVPDPIVIEYFIKTDKAYHVHPTAFDVDIEVDNWELKGRAMKFVQNSDVLRQIAALDEKLLSTVDEINQRKLKRDFMLAFSKDPSGFISKFLASQARDLEVVLGEPSDSFFGEATHTGDENLPRKVSRREMRNAQTYSREWVKEAVTRYMSTKRPVV